MVCTLLYSVVVLYWSVLSKSFRLISLVLGWWYDCPSASEVTWKNMTYICWKGWYNHSKTKHNKLVFMFNGIYCLIVVNHGLVQDCSNSSAFIGKHGNILTDIFVQRVCVCVCVGGGGGGGGELVLLCADIISMIHFILCILINVNAFFFHIYL